MSVVPLTSQELELPAHEMVLTMNKYGYPMGSLLFQAEYIPAHFVGFSITILVIQDEAELRFLSLDSDVRRLKLELKKLKGHGVEDQPIRTDSLNDYVFIPWEEVVQLSRQEIDNTKNVMETIAPHELNDVKNVSSDGITLRGKAIKLGVYANDFFAFSPLAHKEPIHSRFFRILLELASSNLKEDLSIQCLTELMNYFDLAT